MPGGHRSSPPEPAGETVSSLEGVTEGVSFIRGLSKGVAACRWHAFSDRSQLPLRSALNGRHWRPAPEPAGETAMPPPLELDYIIPSPSRTAREKIIAFVPLREGAGGGLKPTRATWQVRPECGQRKAQLSSDCAFDACLLARMRGPPARVPSGIIFHRKIMPTLLRCFLRSLRSWDSVPHPASFLKKA